MSWNECLEKGGSKEKSEVNYVKFVDGNNQFRILDAEPKAVWVHWLAGANQGKGLSVVCLGKGCPMCEKLKMDKATNAITRDRIQRQFVINVYNRNTKQVELLQKGKSIFETLATYNQSMGDITGYDINIIKAGKGLDTKYTPIPVMKSEAVPSDLELYNLDDVTQVFDKEVVLMLMAGMTIEEAKNTINGEKSEIASTSNNEDIGVVVDDGIMPF